MSKSRARFLAEVLGTTGLVKKSKSALAGADEVIDLTSLPSLPNSKLTNSSISIAGHSTALGGSVNLDTADIGEDTNLYFTTARARGAISVSGNAISYNSSTGVITASFEEGPVFTGSVTAAGLTSSAATNINAAFTVKNNYNETKFVRNADVSSVGAAGYYLSIGALNGSSVVTPNVINAVTDTDGTSSSFAIMQDGANSLSFNSSKNATFSGHVTISGTNNVYVGDNGKFIAGNSDDLQIYHTSSDSIIRDAGTGRLLIGSNEFLVTNAALSEPQIKSIEDGAVLIYYNGQEKLETTSTGIDVTGVAVVDGLTSSGAVTSTSGSNSFGATAFTAGITITGLTSSAAVTSTTSNSNAFGGTNFTGTVSVNGNTFSDTSRNIYTNNISAAGNVAITGNLTVSGTTTTLNTATLDVEDKNITLNYGTGDTTGSANGAGITIQDAIDSSTDASITWSTAGDNFNVSHSWNTLGYLQHTGVLYSRNNLLVLNSAGNGWNTWATRSNGNFNLNVGSIQTAGTILANNAGADKKFRWLRTGGNAFSLEHDASGYYFWNETTSDLLMRFTNAGNVGIGINAPDQPLMVKGTIETQATNSTNGWQLYTHTDNTFRINYNGAGSDEVMIHSDGRVGVATTSPVSGHKLTVNGKIGGPTYSDSYLQFDHSSGNTILKANDDLIMGYNSGLRIRNSGKVGINESNPYSLLHITRTATDAYTAGAFNNVPLITLEHTNADTQYAGIRFTNAVGNYEHFLGSVQTGGNTADMVFQGYDRAASAYKEYLRINDGGNVGIGTTAPLVKLDVKGSPSAPANSGTAQTGSLRISQTAGNGVLDMGFYTSSNGTAWLQSTNKTNLATNYDIALQPNGGKVGIGTDNPAQTLHVSSTGATSNGIRISNSEGSFETRVDQGEFYLYDVDDNRIPFLIDTLGKVGIGTTTPDAKFEVEWTGTNVSTDSISRITAPIYPSLEFYSTNTNTGNRNWKIASVYNSYGTLEFLRSSAANGVPNTTTLAMKNNGNVGIGTHSPDAKLDLRGDMRLDGSAGTDRSIYFRNQGTVGGQVKSDKNLSLWAGNGSGTATQYLTVKEGGNVGIGTDNPANKLQIGSVGSTSYGGNNLAMGDGTRVFATYINPTADSVEFYTNRKYAFLTSGAGGTGYVGIGNSNPTLPLTVTSNSGANAIAIRARSADDYGFIQFYNHAGTALRGQIFNHNGAIGISTSTTGTARLHIDTAGNVGIGTTNPAVELHINDTSGLSAIRLTGGASSADNFQIMQGVTGVTNAGFSIYDVDETATRFVINTSGYVGIGKESPTARLDVLANDTVWAGQIKQANTSNGDGLFVSVGSTASADYALSVRTNDGAHSGLAVKADGKVGIGTFTPNNPLTVKAANCTIDAQSTADGQTIGFRAGYLNHTTLHGLFRYTTGDAQLYIDNDFIGNNGLYSDINFRNKSTATGGSLINRLKIKGSTGHVGIGVTTPAHQLTVQHDTDPSIYIVGNGYNDTVRIGFGGGDVNNVMASGNTGAIISSAQTTSGGAALGDLRFQINKGDNLQTALHLSNQGYATFDHQGNEYGLDIKTSGTSRSGLVIRTPATTNITGSLLVLADTTYRIGTASHYHQRMDQDGKTQVGFDKEVSIGDHYGNNYTAARFNVNAGTGTGAGATGKTVWYGPRGRGHKSFAGQDAFNIYDVQREWTNKHIDAGGNTVNQTSSQNFTNDHGLQVNYPSNVTSQQLIYSDTPKGGAGTILRAQADSASAWNGGFQSNTFPCNVNVGLQYSMYVRRASSQSAGTFYMGCHNAYPGGTSTTVNTNPYFYVTSMASLPQGVWCLVVAYLSPINFTGSLPSYTGIYRLDTGDRLAGQTTFRHYSASQTIRTYMYYAGDGLTKCDWYAPRMHLVDGTEPSITQLMGYGRVYGSFTDL